MYTENVESGTLATWSEGGLTLSVRFVIIHVAVFIVRIEPTGVSCGEAMRNQNQDSME